MNKKGFTIIEVVLVLAVIAAGAWGYLVLTKEEPGSETNTKVKELIKIPAFNHIEYALFGSKFLVNGPGGFEGYRNGNTLFVADLDTKEIKKIEKVIGFAFLDSLNVLLAKEPLRDSNYCKKLVEEQGIGCGELAATADLFKLNLDTGLEVPLNISGVAGGIFKLKDGTIYVSGNPGSAYYLSAEVQKKYDTVFFGWKPYYRFDSESEKLIQMPDDFVPDFSKVDHPLVSRQFGEFKTFLQEGAVHLYGKDSEFYLEVN